MPVDRGRFRQAVRDQDADPVAFYRFDGGARASGQL